MARYDAGEIGDSAAWPPGRSALHIDRWVDPRDAAPTSLVLRHLSAPFVAHVPDALTDEGLRTVGYCYLVTVVDHFRRTRNPDFELPDNWLNSLDPSRPGTTFAWQPAHPPAGGGSDYDPLQSSFWVERQADADTTDRTVILLASEGNEANRFLGSGFGLRLVLHVTEYGEPGQQVRIVAMSASLPFGIYRTAGLSTQSCNIEHTEWCRGAVESARIVEWCWGHLEWSKVKARVASVLQLEESSVHYHGFRLADLPDRSQVQIEARGTGVRPDQQSFRFLVLLRLSGSGDVVRCLARSNEPLVTDAAPGTARVFPHDPPSSRSGRDEYRRRRNTRREEMLDAYRREIALCVSADCKLANADVEVYRSVFVRQDRLASDGKTVVLNEDRFPPVRSNDFAAVSAYDNSNELFDRMRRYGIDPAGYFRMAQRPLRVYYRSGIRPGRGKDGQTTNARVIGKFEGSSPRPFIELHLALANRSHRARAPWAGNEPSQAEPLGIAADKRWMWHEFGHVLLMASLGELEFRFAHSAGDGLAAIVSDPHSRLADRSLSPNMEHWRGVTFPWVSLTRRHDRCVLNGWSWSGSLHRAARLLFDEGRRFKAYQSEQILSTTLFRLYRCLGGDTMRDANGTPDLDAREAASHYAVYLVMQAIQLLGTPPLRAEEFAEALMQADTGTVSPFTVPLESGKSAERIGGCAHKLIRWAFEAQGLYPTDASALSNAPGDPEAVDIYIEDDRTTEEVMATGRVRHNAGGYVPVSLDWGETPEWHAASHAIRHENGEITVTVNNRGRERAENVTVRVWSRDLSDSPESLKWHGGSDWTECGTIPAQDVPPGTATAFGAFPVAATAGCHLIFAQATCADDCANSDPASGLPCSTRPAPLVDLVAGDNNLGLRIIRIK